MSHNKALEITQLLTGDEILALAGLDDVKVVKGRENWNKTTAIAKEILKGCNLDEMLKRIDNQETFYSTDYIPHLVRI